MYQVFIFDTDHSLSIGGIVPFRLHMVVVEQLVGHKFLALGHHNHQRLVGQPVVLLVVHLRFHRQRLPEYPVELFTIAICFDLRY